MSDFDEYEDIKRRHRAGNGADGELRSRALFWSSLHQLPEPEYLVKGVIERGALIEIYGPHSCGKSFFSCDLGLHIALGRAWRGHRVRQGGVLYIAAEGGTNIKRRLAAFAKRHDIDLDAVPIAAVLAPTNLLTPEGIAQIIADAKSVPGIAVIIIDTAARTMPGGKEDTEDFGKFVAACDAIRAATGAAIIVIHHTGKDIGRGSRGAVVLPAAVDTIIAITQDKNAKTSTATIEKARDGEIGAVFTFKLHVVELGADGDGDRIVSCVVEPVNNQDETNEASEPTRKGNGAKPKLPDSYQVALDLLRNALSYEGKEPPASNHIPTNRTVVSVDIWRRYYLAATSGKDVSDNARRKAFLRASDALQARKRIGLWQQLVWEI